MGMGNLLAWVIPGLASQPKGKDVHVQGFFPSPSPLSNSSPALIQPDADVTGPGRSVCALQPHSRPVSVVISDMNPVVPLRRIIDGERERKHDPSVDGKLDHGKLRRAYSMYNTLIGLSYNTVCPY